MKRTVAVTKKEQDTPTKNRVLVVVLLVLSIAVIICAAVSVWIVNSRAEKRPFGKLQACDIKKICIRYGVYPDYRMSAEEETVFLAMLNEVKTYEKIASGEIDGGYSGFYFIELSNGKRYNLEFFSATPSVVQINGTAYRMDSESSAAIGSFYTPYPAIIRKAAREGGTK